MPEIAHTMPVLIRNDEDMAMLRECLDSLKGSMDHFVFYNQGGLSNYDLSSLIDAYLKDFTVLGKGTNDGIPFARQSCFQYIWVNLPAMQYITEIHPDMLFPKDWPQKLVEFLEDNKEEPCISPGILTKEGQWHPHGKGIFGAQIPSRTDELVDLLVEKQEEKVVEGFVHPVMHRASCLKKAGGYIVEDLPGMQGYEDDYLLLSYYHRLRLPENWKPKALLSIYVFHRTMAQRADFSNMEEESNKNLQGLLKRFGTQGIMDLQHIHSVKKKENIRGSIYFFGTSSDKDVPFIRGVNPYIIHSQISKERSLDQFEQEKASDGNVKNIAVVDHPYWLNSVSKICPQLTIARITEHVWNPTSALYRKGICAVADIILTDSEEIHWQLALSHPFILLCPSLNKKSHLLNEDEWGIYSDSDYYLKEIIESSFEDGDRTETWQGMINKQRQERIRGLQDILEWEPHNEVNLSLLAKYYYITQQYEEAENYFFQAFLRNVLVHKMDGLNRYYPGICLAQLRQGKTKEALNSYGILAQTDDMKQHYHQLLPLYNKEEYEWLQAEISRLLGDIRYARDLIDQTASPEADGSRYLFYRDMLDYKGCEEILRKRGDGVASAKEHWLLQGEKEELFGEPQRALHHYLQASIYEEKAIENILRLEAVDRFMDGGE